MTNFCWLQKYSWLQRIFFILRVGNLLVARGNDSHFILSCAWVEIEFVNCGKRVTSPVLQLIENTVTLFEIFCLTCDGINNIRWSDKNLYVFLETHFQKRFSVNVWFWMTYNPFFVSVILPHCRTGPSYQNFLGNHLLALVDYKNEYVFFVV